MSPALRNSLLALAAGLAVAFGVWFMLPHSGPPPQALAICDESDLLILAEPGGGFYGVERKDDRRWAWAGGPATLVLRRLDQGTTPHPLRLRFNLHSLTPREVTVRYGEFVLWKGPLSGAAKTKVDIPTFTMTGPIAELMLTSDQPGSLVPSGQDPRPLAFAVYDLEVTSAE
jgi:hypothetical protein